MKRILYMEGIRGNIDAGTWDNLEENERLDEFGHLFIWQTRPNNIVIGRMWSSSDGKGRTRYPMVVCAHCTGLPRQWAINLILPKLEYIDRACRDTRSAAVVRSIIGSAQAELQEMIDNAEMPAKHTIGSTSAIAALADAPELGVDHIGLDRLLYVMAEDLKAYRRKDGNGSNSQSHHMVIRPQHVRVPPCAADPAAVAELWLQFFYSDLNPQAPILFIMPLAHQWADVLIGEPSTAQLFVVRARPRKVPLTSDIPYSLDDLFTRDVQERIAFAREDPQNIETSLDPATPARPKPHKRTDRRARSRVRTSAVVLIVLGLVAAVVAAYVVFQPFAADGSSDAREQIPVRNADPGPPKTARSNDLASPVEAPVSSDPLNGWKALGRATYNWFWSFAEELESDRRDRYVAEPHLAEIIVTLDAARREGVELQPDIIAGQPGADTRSLAAPLPGANGYDAACQAIDVFESVQVSLLAWTQSLRQLDQQVASRNWPATGLARLADDIQATVDGSGSEGRLLDMLDQSTMVAQRVQRVFTAVESLENRASAIGKVDNPVPRAFPAFVSRRLASDDNVTLERIATAAMSLEQLAVQLEDVLNGAWRDQIDQHLVSVDSVSALPPEIDESVFSTWSREVKSARFVLLDPADDPRQTSDWSRDALLGETIAQLDRLQTEFSQPPDPDVVGQVDAIAARIVLLDGLRWNGSTKQQLEDGVPELRKKAADLRAQVNQQVGELLTTREEYMENLAGQHAVVTNSEVINDIWRDRRDTLLASDLDMASLRTQAGEITTALQRVNERITTPTFGTAPSGPIGTRLFDAMRDEREAVLIRLLAKFEPAEESIPAEAIDQANAALSETLGRLDAVHNSATQLEAWTRACYRVDATPDPDGLTVGDLCDAMMALDAVQQASVSTAVAPLTERIDILREIAVETDRDKLIAIVDIMDENSLWHGMAAWRQICELECTGDPNELNEHDRMRRHLNTAVDHSMHEAPRAIELNNEINAALPVQWQRHIEAVRTPDAIETAMERRADFAVDDQALPPATQFNLQLYELSRIAHDLAWGTRERDAELLDLLQSKSAQLDEIIASVDDPAWREQAARASAGIRAMLDEPPSPEVDMARVGPGAATALPFELIEQTDTSVTYRMAGGGEQLSIRFVRVDSGDGRTEPTYVAVDEVSVGLLMDVIGEAEAWQAIRPWLRDADPRRLEVREGPVGWEWALYGQPGQRIRLSRRWLSESLVEKRGVYPNDLTVDRPSAHHPVQHISAGAAMFFARIMNCRLPTAFEWTAAHQHAEHGEISNVRDQTWKRQWDHVQSLRQPRPDDPLWVEPRTVLPDAGAHDAGHSSAGITADLEDGLLWFEVVHLDAPHMRHLDGNVSEFVLMTDQAGRHLDRIAVGGIEEFWEQFGSAVGIIGGSAMSIPNTDRSPGATPLETALVADAALRGWGYADVGFRLAFTAAGSVKTPDLVADRLASCLEASGYVLHAVDGPLE